MVATTSWPSTWGNEMNAVIGLSSAPSKSMRTCLVSEPQMPVMRLVSTAQSSPMRRGSSMSWRNIGVYARWRSRRGASSGGCGGIGSGNSPNTRAFMRSLLRPGCVSRLRHLCDTGEEHVDLVRLERGDVLHVGAVHLEAVALDRVDDRLRDRLG